MTKKNFLSHTELITPTISSQYVSDGKYLFPASVITVMLSVHAWGSMEHAIKYSVNGIDIYLVLAHNASYFKADGQTYCVQYFIHNPFTNDCWLESCRCLYKAKDCIDPLLSYRETIRMQLLTLSLNDFKKKAEEKKESHPWQIAGVKNGHIKIYQQFNNDEEQAKILTAAKIAEDYVDILERGGYEKDDIIKRLAADIEKYHADMSKVTS